MRFDLSIAKKHTEKTEFSLLRDGKNSKRLRDIKIFPYPYIACSFSSSFGEDRQELHCSLNGWKCFCQPVHQVSVNIGESTGSI